MIVSDIKLKLVGNSVGIQNKIFAVLFKITDCKIVILKNKKQIKENRWVFRKTSFWQNVWFFCCDLNINNCRELTFLPNIHITNYELKNKCWKYFVHKMVFVRIANFWLFSFIFIYVYDKFLLLVKKAWKFNSRFRINFSYKKYKKIICESHKKFYEHIISWNLNVNEFDNVYYMRKLSISHQFFRCNLKNINSGNLKHSTVS